MEHASLIPMPLTPNQIRGFWAAWAGWAHDGMDSFLFALVLVPVLRDLLPRSGIAAKQANTGFSRFIAAGVAFPLGLALLALAVEAGGKELPA